MNRNESVAFLRSDEDDVDYLRDIPMGRCPWCGNPLLCDWDFDEGWVYYHGIFSGLVCHWEHGLDELANRARYQEEREESARLEETINREMRGR